MTSTRVKLIGRKRREDWTPVRRLKLAVGWSKIREKGVSWKG